MKKQLLYITFLVLYLFTGCNKEIESDNIIVNKEYLTINAMYSDFGDENTSTRVSDNGSLSQFDINDKIGVIILEDGKPIINNNLPYVYTGYDWVFDKTTAEAEANGKTPYGSTSSSKNMTYIVYFPYTPEADDVNSVSGLKNIYNPESEQSSEENYRKSDLLVWSDFSEEPILRINAKLKHQYSAFSITVKTDYILDNTSKTKLLMGATAVKGLTISTGDIIGTPFKCSDNSYRYILPENFSGDIRWFYELEGILYSGSRTVENAEGNTRFVQNETKTSIYSFDCAKNGDYYCVEEGKGFLLPHNIMTDKLKDYLCLGVVFYVGDEIIADNFNLLSNKTKGLVISTNNAKLDNSELFSWGYGGKTNISEWLANSQWTNPSRPNLFTSLSSQSKPQGYANTMALRKYNESLDESSNNRCKMISALDQYESVKPAPISSSGWFCPSVHEIKIICRGQANADGSGHAGLEMINTQLSKISGTVEVELLDYWSSTEYDAEKAINFYIKDNWFGTTGSDKAAVTYKMRPILAF